MHPLCFLSPLVFGERGHMIQHDPVHDQSWFNYKAGRFISLYMCGLILRLAHWPLHALLWNDLFRSGATNGIDCQDYSSRNLPAMKAIDTGFVGCYEALSSGQHRMLEGSPTQVSTVAYLFFAAAHFLYSPLNPWPEILKQRRKRLGRWHFDIPWSPLKFPRENDPTRGISRKMAIFKESIFNGAFAPGSNSWATRLRSCTLHWCSSCTHGVDLKRRQIIIRRRPRIHWLRYAFGFPFLMAWCCLAEKQNSACLLQCP